MPEIEQIKELVPVENQLPLLSPMYNVAPSAKMPVIVYDQGFQVQLMSWNYLPHWASPAYKPIINARAETIETKPYFRDSFEKRRCIIPANGFYEWQRQTKQPYYIRLTDQPIFGFAGLYDNDTYAIITTNANGRVSEIHPRMPVILHRESLLEWFQTTSAEAKKLLAPYDTDQTIATPISKSINNPSINNRELLNLNISE